VTWNHFLKTPLWIDFAPKFLLLEKVVPSFREKRQEAARQEFLNADRTWKKTKEKNDLENTVASNEYLQACSDWDKQKKSHEEANLAEVNAMRDLYSSKDPETLNGYCKVVLERSTPFPTFPKTHSCDYQPETHTLIVQYDLPTIDCIPRVQEVSYSESRKAFGGCPLPRYLAERVLQSTNLQDFHEGDLRTVSV
jgi:restriction system protein